MNLIKFSKQYCKLHGQTCGVLLAVRRIKIDKLNPHTELLEYDTLAEDGSRYALKHGKYLQLIFIGEHCIPFCTLRSDRPAWHGMESKYDYYHQKIGQNFDFVA